MLCCAMAHFSATPHHTIKNDKCSHQLLSQVSNHCPMLLQPRVCPSSSTGNNWNNHLFCVSHLSFTLRLILVIVKVQSSITVGHNREIQPTCFGLLERKSCPNLSDTDTFLLILSRHVKMYANLARFLGGFFCR